MSAYVLVEIEVLDQERYETYKQLALSSIAVYGGRYLARGRDARHHGNHRRRASSRSPSVPRGPRAFPEARRRMGALRWSSTRFRLSWLGPYPMSISTMITHGISWREQCSSPVKRL